MRAVNKLSTILALGLAMLLFRIGPAGAAVFEVWINTSRVSGDAVMAFDLDDSDPGANHQLVITEFRSDGALFVSAPPEPPDPADCQPSPPFPFPVGGTACKDPEGSSVTGTLGRTPSVTISDAVLYDPPKSPISYYQRIALPVALPDAPPPSISFRFEMSGDPTTDGGSPDGFTFWLLDPLSDVGAPIGPGPLVLYTFGGSCGTESSEGSATCEEVRVPSVPEPGTVVLTVAALLALITARWRASAVRRQSAVRA